MSDAAATMLFAAFISHCILVYSLVRLTTTGKPLIDRRVDQVALDEKLDDMISKEVDK